MDGSTAGHALFGVLGLTLVCLGLLARHDRRFYAALVRHVETQRRMHGQASLTADYYERDRRPVATALLGSGWLLLLLGLFPLLNAMLSP